jgi:hypothetical protein
MHPITKIHQEQADNYTLRHPTGTKSLRWGSIVQNHAQQVTVDRQTVGGIDKAQVFELIMNWLTRDRVVPTICSELS